MNVCYGSPGGHTIESNIELAFDPPELSRWQRFWRSGWGIATAFVALIAAVLILPLKALAVAAVFVAVSLGIGGVVAGVRSSNRGSGFWDGLGRFITDNWSSSVALGMGLSLVSFGVGKAAAWIAKAASKKQVASGVTHQQKIPATDTLQKKIHGNSLETTKPTELYELIHNETGRIMKIGETTMGTKRYTKKFYLNNKVEMHTIAKGTKKQMRTLEKIELMEFFDHHGHLPPFNMLCR